MPFQGQRLLHVFFVMIRFTVQDCILVVGTGLEAEGNDRSELDLPGYQLQLLKDAIFYSTYVMLLWTVRLRERILI